MTLVLKFGGTSVGSGERMVHVANIIKQRSQKSIIVLSAMSKAVKSDGTTSKLLLACNEILMPDSQIYLDIINQIELDHLTELEIALAVSPNASNIRSTTRFEIQQICHRLKSFMAAAEIINEISPRTMDYIVSTGEILSALMFHSVLMANVLSIHLGR
jgi:aspartate kinase